jgi:hypothetical protein
MTLPYQPTFHLKDSDARSTVGVYAGYDEVEDNGTWVNHTTGVATAPVAGKYLISATLIQVGGAGLREAVNAVIRKNGTAITSSMTTSTTATAETSESSMTFVATLAASDTVDCYLSFANMSGGNTWITNFSMALLG